MASPVTVGELTETLRQGGYLADRGLATALFVALSLNRPVLLEGEVGVGKTEVAKVMASAFGRKLIRLQCYEGIDTNQALYEWDYARQMLHIRALSEHQLAGDDAVDKLFGPKFLLERPLLEAVRAGDRAVLLIDEIDRADDEFEAFLLEVLSDFQISIPEIGTVTAESAPLVVLTSNRTRELHDALEASLPVPLDRLPGRRTGGRDRPDPRAGRVRGAGPQGGRGRAPAPPARPGQAAGSGGDHRLGPDAGLPGRDRPESRQRAGHARRGGQGPR